MRGSALRIDGMTVLQAYSSGDRRELAWTRRATAHTRKLTTSRRSYEELVPVECGFNGQCTSGASSRHATAQLITPCPLTLITLLHVISSLSLGVRS